MREKRWKSFISLISKCFPKMFLFFRQLGPAQGTGAALGRGGDGSRRTRNPGMGPVTENCSCGLFFWKGSSKPLEAQRSFVPNDPMDIGINRASFSIAAYNGVFMVLNRACIHWGTGRGNGIALLIKYTARSGRFEIQPMVVPPC